MNDGHAREEDASRQPSCGARREGEGRYRLLIEQGMVGFYCTTPEGQVLDCNEAFARLLGYRSRQDVLHCQAWEFYFDHADREDFLARLQSSGALTAHETCLRRQDGCPVWVLEEAMLVEQAGLRPHIQGMAFDITERKQAENALRQAEQRYRALFERTNDGVITLSLDDVFLEVNQRAAETLGYRVDELVGRSMLDVVMPDEVEDALVKGKALLAGQKLPVYERTLRRKDGAAILAEINIELVYDETGQPSHYHSVVRDITARRQAEKNRLALAVEKERVRILADFIAGVSHEFNTPLAIINSGLYLLEKSEEPAQRAARIESLKEQTAYLGELVGAMLTMTRLDSEAALDFRSLNLNSLLSDIETAMRSQIEAKRLRWVLCLDSELPAVQGDQQALHRALANLVKNAVLYTPHGGSITVETGQQGGHAVVTIRDTGVGISDEDLPRIFERFYRGDQARSSRGAGLGLPIARKIVEMHGGRIEVESTLGEGSTFVVRLPLPEASS